MDRSASHLGRAQTTYAPRRPAAARGARSRPLAVGPAAPIRWLLAVLRVLIGSAIIVAAALLGPGLFLDTPQPALRASDAIVVISGDEQMARFQEGVNLYDKGLGHYLV